MADNVFTNVVQTQYTEEAEACDFAEFQKVARSRRSVRVYTEDKIPDHIVQECLDIALLAPNSSNLQPWEFYWVDSPEAKNMLQKYCLNQPAARTAQTLIVCVARPDRWKLGKKINLDYFNSQSHAPASILDYYNKLVPFVYGNGPLDLLGPIKSFAVSLVGLFKVVPRGPFGRGGNIIWAHKTTSLACENLMLAFRAAGYDSCPMEGFDEVRVKKLLRLPRAARITMVISAGKRAIHGVYAPRLRGDKNLFVHKV